MSAGKATKKEPMTFSKSFRGRWTNKNIPVIPKKMSKKRSYLMHRRRTSLQFSDQYLEQFRAFAMKEGAQVIFYVTDNKDGTFTSGFKMGKLSQKCVFKLDGKPVNMTGNTDGKEMTSTNTFKKGVWKSKITRTGCPDVILERKRVGDEIETREQIEDFAIESLMIRAPKLNRNSSTSLERKTPPITEKTENKRKSSASPKPKTPVPPVEKKKKSALIEKKKLSNKSGKKSVSFELEVASPGAGKRKSPEPKRKVSEPPKKKSLRSTKGK